MIRSGRGWRKPGMCEALHRVLGWSDGGMASAPRALMLLLSCRSLGKRWQQPGPTCLLRVRAAPGWQRGLVQWLVPLESGVTWDGGDDCSMALMSSASLNPGRRRGKVFGKEGRAAQAEGLEVAVGPWRPTWLTASMLQDSSCDAHAAEASRSAGGLPQAMKYVGVHVRWGQGSRGVERHLSRPQPPA